VSNSKKDETPRFGVLPSILLGVSLALTVGCSSGSPAGAVCVRHGDCAADLQCLAEVCVVQCNNNRECGDGYQCTSSGICEQVISQLGDACTSERQCGQNQRCQLEQEANEFGRIPGTCQEQLGGSNLGAECVADGNCRSGLCTIGRCSELCTVNADCPDNTDCTELPRMTASGPALFSGCLQNSGVLKISVSMSESAEQLQIPVPSSARSFALVTTTEDPSHFVGATRVLSPSGKLIFNADITFEEQEVEKLRYLRKKQVSTLFVPNRDTMEIETGFYTIDVEASLGEFFSGTETPKVTVVYKLDDRRLLDLHFYFLDLEEHPCRDTFGSTTLNSELVGTSGPFQNSYLSRIEEILGEGALTIGQTTYTDIKRADLDGVVSGDLPSLFQLSTNESGIAIFFVRSLSPDGVQAMIGGTPGPPRIPGTAASGIAISADTLCYRSWQDLARVTSHSIAGQMGLWNNRDPQGQRDPISDSGSSSDNLMFFGEFGGTELSACQKRILGIYPGLR